jgi:putative FmdB family regulatory protein
MPIYRYHCKSCDESHNKMAINDHECPKCKAKLIRTLGLASSQANETIDQYRSKTSPVDQRKKIEERAHEHFVKHDLPNIIQQEGLDFAKRQGFVDEDGNPK